MSEEYIKAVGLLDRLNASKAGLADLDIGDVGLTNVMDKVKEVAPAILAVASAANDALEFLIERALDSAEKPEFENLEVDDGEGSRND